MDVRKVIERAKIALGVSTDTELAKLLGVKQNTISAWKTRGNIDLVSIIMLMGHGLSWPAPISRPSN